MNRFSFSLLVLSALLATWLPKGVQAHDPTLNPMQVLGALGFDQRLNAEVPRDLVFKDENGQRVTLGSFFATKPVILSLGYFECPNLCPLVRHGLLAGLQGVSFTAGQDFTVLAVSIDPTETPAVATKVKQEYVQAYDRPSGAAGWRFLTTDHATIDRLSQAVGFRYAYDTRQRQFAHASGVVILTPEGRVARYLFGIEFPPRELRLALVEAAGDRIGSVVDQVLLYCYHYNPVTGQYDVLIMNVIRLAGLITVCAVAGLVLVLLRREQQVGMRSQ